MIITAYKFLNFLHLLYTRNFITYEKQVSRLGWWRIRLAKCCSQLFWMYEFNVNGVIGVIGLIEEVPPPMDCWRLLSERLNAIIRLPWRVFCNNKFFDRRDVKLSQLLILLPIGLPPPDWLVPYYRKIYWLIFLTYFQT